MLTLALLALPFGAKAVTLNLDYLPGMENIPGMAVPLANQLTNQLLYQSVMVTSDGGFGAVSYENGFIGTGWKHNDASVKSGLGGSNASGQLSYDSPITFTFVDPILGSAPRFTSSFSAYTDWCGWGEYVSITGFDLNGKVVAHTSGHEHNGNNEVGTQFSISGVNIHRVVIYGAWSTAFSNIAFGTPYVNPVPEPASLVVMLSGGLHMVLRGCRRRRTAK
ncbi:MAG: PEP-CTERM sorting domain-containing protein [Fimbriimonas sp.]